MLRLIITFISAFAAVALIAGCGDDGSSDGGTQVVATTTQLADIASNVAGDRAEVSGVLQPNSDPHDYEPRPSDAEAFTDAAVIVDSGGDLDTWAGDLEESAESDGEVITILDEVEQIEGGHAHGDDHAEEEHEGEEVDPHWWQNPQNAVIATERIRDALIEADPEGASEYERNAEAYISQIENLDAQIERCIGRIPAGERKLVTTHDALGYYADRYGLEVVGAAIPALTTQAQPSAGETAELVDLIRSEGVKAIFPESGINPDLETAIADEARATVGGTLYADALGEPSTPGATYLGSLSANTETIASGLTGQGTPCNLKGAP